MPAPGRAAGREAESWGRFIAPHATPHSPLRNETQAKILGRGRRGSRATHRAIALAREPVLEVRVVQPHDAADLEDRERITRATRHVPAPALRATKCRGDALPGLDEIRHCISSVCEAFVQRTCRGRTSRATCGISWT